MFDLITKHNNSLYEYNRKNHNYSPDAKRRKEESSKFDDANFIAWDGEGTQDGKVQVYSLLANSFGDYLIDINGLSTEDCLEFITSDRYPHNAIHVCFGASYDVNMLMKDIPEELLLKIHKGNRPIRWGRFDIEYRPRKSFTVRRYQTEIRNGVEYLCFDRDKNRYIIEKSVTLWDVFGFFQAKFVKVLKEWFKNTEYEHKYAQVILDIELGKQKRGQFTTEELKTFVLPYCLSECEALKDLMIILHGYLNDVGLKITRWDGAGAIAASILKKYKIKEHIRVGEKLDQEPYPQYMIEAFESAYFGGWIEGFMFGLFDQNIYHYDERSAYPDKTKDLLSLTQGEWKTLSFGKYLPLSELKEVIDTLPSYWVGHIKWSNGPLYGPCPFSWRNRIGSVSKPIRGKGWQWNKEIMVAYRHFKQMDFSIDQIHYFIPSEGCVKPFAFIQEYYDLRKKFKAMGLGIEKVYKLGINSIYGKLAQSLGYNDERGIKPPYHCIVYAGLITSETRAELLDAAMQNPLSIISVATDGIYSLAPLDLDIGDDLGQWEFTLHEKMVLVQPGFYWYVTDGNVKHYYRGFNEGCIEMEDVIEAYEQGKDKLLLPVTRFVTLGASIGLATFKHWRTWRTVKRALDLVMNSSSKRIWKGEFFPGSKTIRVTRNKIYNPSIFSGNPILEESRKYTFDWDNKESGIFDGVSQKELVEDLFHQELSPD